MFIEQNFFQRAAKPLQGILQGNGQGGENCEFLVRATNFPLKVWERARLRPITPWALGLGPQRTDTVGLESLVLNYQKYHGQLLNVVIT